MMFPKIKTVKDAALEYDDLYGRSGKKVTIAKLQEYGENIFNLNGFAAHYFPDVMKKYLTKWGWKIV